MPRFPRREDATEREQGQAATQIVQLDTERPSLPRLARWIGCVSVMDQGRRGQRQNDDVDWPN